jgi:hypothetical protein
MGYSGHLWGCDTAATVQGREDFAESDHLPANAGFFFDQGYLIPLISQIKSGLHPRYSTSHNKSINLDFSQGLSPHGYIIFNNGMIIHGNPVN